MKLTSTILKLVSILMLGLGSAHIAQAEFSVFERTTTASAQSYAFSGEDPSDDDFAEGTKSAEVSSVSGTAFAAAKTIIANEPYAGFQGGYMYGIARGFGQHATPLPGGFSNATYFASSSGRVLVETDVLTKFYLVYAVNGLCLNESSSCTGATQNLATFVQVNNGTAYASEKIEFEGRRLRIDAGVTTRYASSNQSGDTTIYHPSGLLKNFAVQWGAGFLPGATVEHPLIPEKFTTPAAQQEDSEEDPSDQAVEVTGAFLTIPVVGEYGVSDFVYVDPAIATGYLFEAEGANFASFIVPVSLPGGDDVFSLRFAGLEYALQAGEEFNFTDYVSEGVGKFRLLGIDPGENIDSTQSPPFVSGFKFTNEGVISLTQTPIVVPEPTCAMMFVGIAILVNFRRQSVRRRQTKVPGTVRRSNSNPSKMPPKEQK